MSKILSIFVFVLLMPVLSSAQLATKEGLALTAQMVNTVADYESFLNFYGIVTGQKDQTDLIKSKADKQSLKMRMPKAKLIDDQTLQLGKHKITAKDDKIFIDGKLVKFDPKKSLFENFQNNKSTNNSLFSFLVPNAHAGSLFNLLDYAMAGTLIAYQWKIKDWFVPWVAAMYLIIRPGSANAADGVVPLQTCDSKTPGTYTSSFQDMHKRIKSYEFKLNPNGTITLTTKTDGFVDMVTVFQKHMGKASIQQMTNGRGEPTAGAGGSGERFAEYAYMNFEVCNDPKKRTEALEKTAELKKSIAAGDIKLAEENLKQVESGSKATH